MKKFLPIFVCFLLLAGWMYTQQMNLNDVIKRAARSVEEVLPQRAMVAVLNFVSPTETFSDYVIEELTGELVAGRRVTIVDRRNLALISQEMNLQLSGDVSDESAQAIGRKLGAQSIVSGTLTNMGSFYRFRVKVINVETAAIQTQVSLDLQNDAQVAFLLNGSPTASEKTTTPSTPATQPAPAPTPTTYKVGDTGPGGGKIFYVNEAGFTLTTNTTICHYLEAAPADVGNLRWATSRYNNTSMETKEEAIGTGKSNTDIILETDISAPAAEACKEYRGGGKNDWFLPSIAELAQLYRNRRSVGGLGSSNYWSSTQDPRWSYYAWCLNFSNGDQAGNNKNNTYAVRPIRAF